MSMTDKKNVPVQKAPLSQQKTKMMTRVSKVTKNYTGPITDCDTVAGYVANCASLQNALAAWLTGQSINGVTVSNTNRITALENAGYITCTDITTCPIIIGINSQISSKIGCSDLSSTCLETIQDIVGNMFTGSVAVGITATYNDTNGKIDLIVQPGSGDFCNFVMACQGIIDIRSGLTDHEIRISAIESGSGTSGLQNQIDQINLDLNSVDSRVTVVEGQVIDHEGRISALEAGGTGGLDCAGVMACSGITTIRTQLDNAYTGSSWNASTKTITFTEVDGGTEDLILSGITIPEQSFSCAAVLTKTCVHGLNAHPVGVAIDGSGNMVVPAGVLYADVNTTVYTFNLPFTGTIYIR